MSRRIACALLLVVSTPLAAQALPDTRALLPDGYVFLLRADLARIQQSEFWRVFSHTALVKTFLEQTVPDRLGFEVDDLKRLQVGIRDATGGHPESVSLYLEGTSDLKAEAIVANTRQWSGEREEETIAGRRCWLLQEGDPGPSVVELGPGMAWLASPAKFVRERLPALQKGSPHAPSEVMRKLLTRDRGDCFLASCNDGLLRMLNERLAATAGTKVAGVWLQAEAHPDLILRAGLLLEDAVRTEQAKTAAEKVLAGLAEKAAQEGVQLAGALLKKLELKAGNGELTTEIKVARKDVASVAQGGLLLVFGATRLSSVDEGPAAIQVEAVAEPKKVESKPAEKK